MSEPWIDPRRAANEELLRAQVRLYAAVAEQARTEAQSRCPHLQGSNVLSQVSGANTSIAWHTFEDGHVRGICTNCLRIFDHADSDYTSWLLRSYVHAYSDDLPVGANLASQCGTERPCTLDDEELIIHDRKTVICGLDRERNSERFKQESLKDFLESNSENSPDEDEPVFIISSGASPSASPPPWRTKDGR